MNLHDWIDELCDVLDIDADVDEGLILDLAKTVATNVERPAAPVSAYLLGVAVGRADAGTTETERMAALTQELAERWDRPTGVTADEAPAVVEPTPPDLDLDFGEDDTAPD